MYCTPLYCTQTCTHMLSAIMRIRSFWERLGSYVRAFGSSKRLILASWKYIYIHTAHQVLCLICSLYTVCPARFDAATNIHIGIPPPQLLLPVHPTPLLSVPPIFDTLRSPEHGPLITWQVPHTLAPLLVPLVHRIASPTPPDYTIRKACPRQSSPDDV
jgi:hypothetical protein